MNEAMTISDAGIAYLKQLEEPGGRCRLKAYNDGGGTPTIAWGCTHGVHFGMTITEDQGVVMFKRELFDIEAEMRKWLTRQLDQDTWDLCVMFGYNCGWGKCQAFKNAINDGSPAKIRAAEMLFTHGYSQAAGRVVEWPGLVSRRKQELAYWDTHHNLSVAQGAPVPLPTPVHVGEEAPKVNAQAPPKPPIVVTAVKSRKVWAAVVGKVALVGGVLTNGVHAAIASVFGDTLPPAEAVKQIDVEGFVGELQPKIEATKQLAGWLNINSEMICAGVVLGALVYILMRGSADNQATEIRG